ncbi:MAG TPA: diphthine--ammonia ligase [Candidatus Nanoarchaeia archaeon]|nr:diphthine--ammonia ligase [Candidatus Nanoarchaeia archaeon]
MKLCVLYSGGKDSTLALLKAKEFHDVVCLVTLASSNKESFMFHTPNIDLTSLQAEAMNLPLIRVETMGEKEKELADLKKALELAKQKHKIEGVVTGAILSTYQASRVQQVCHDLRLWCFNPLWLMNQETLLIQIVKSKILAIISGVFAEPLDETFLGQRLDTRLAKKLVAIGKSHKINPAGEGGEIETTVLDAPCFKKKIAVKKSKINYANHSGIFSIIDAELVEK